MSKVKYSIITVGCNGLEDTVKCFNSIFKFSKDFEIIVVDGNSNDGTGGYLNQMAELHPGVVKLIQHDKKLSFAENNNLGIPLAEGEYIIFLNNDTIVTPNWLERMEAHFTRTPLKNVGAVGPVSSSSNGRQMVGLQDSELWHQTYKGHWAHAGILYGWCVMVKKSIIDEIGGFDQRFVNSYEDNDLSLRIQHAGYSLVIARDTYIYHKGSATLKTMMDNKAYFKNGEVNRERYFDKWYDPTPKKLVAVYRTNWGKWLEKSLEQTSKFADSIIIHFCRAPKNFEVLVDNGQGVPYEVDRDQAVATLKSKFPKISHVEFYDGVFQEDYERGRLMELALEMHEKGEADWCISVDDDELYDDRFVDRVQSLMCPRNPEIFAYWCNWRTIWDTRLGKEYYRTDSTFGSFANYRFFKLMKGQKILSFHPEGHHCGSAPWFAEENLRWTNTRVKHMGYDTPEQRQRKYEFYEANDHFKSKADIGYDDYSHLISKNPTLERYDKDTGISLIMMVKNEEDFILGAIENVEYLVDEMVIVDTGSTDRTMELIRNFAKYARIPVKLLEHPWVDNYSIPRNFAKRHASHKWILFMDADERFRPESIRDIMKYAETDLDVVKFNVFNYMEERKENQEPRTALTQSVRLFRNIPEFFFTGIIHETIDDSLAILSTKRKLNVVLATMELHHYGYLKNKEKLRNKLDMYETLNLHQMEVTEELDPRPFHNLALHYINDQKENEALKMFQRALELNPKFWHAHQQMASLNIQSAKHFLNEMVRHMPANHPLRGESEKILRFFNDHCKGFVRIA